MKPRFKFDDLVGARLSIRSAGRCRVDADDWPLVRGDAFGTGVAHTTLPDELEVLWKYPAGKDAGFDATPVVADGVIYVGDNAGTFHAVRLADGNKVGRRTLPTAASQPAPRLKRA